MGVLSSVPGPSCSRCSNRHSSTFDPQFRAITRAAQDLRVDELFERDPLRRWGRGPVTLLGDAAHPMLPHAAQGAAQAIEDAVALALALSNDAPIEHQRSAITSTCANAELRNAFARTERRDVHIQLRQPARAK
jgi:2-polyprenyl-6-methoxyphenol hydroxylase-like FAD-dependent oxidoreductase